MFWSKKQIAEFNERIDMHFDKTIELINENQKHTDLMISDISSRLDDMTENISRLSKDIDRVNNDVISTQSDVRNCISEMRSEFAALMSHYDENAAKRSEMIKNDISDMKESSSEKLAELVDLNNGNTKDIEGNIENVKSAITIIENNIRQEIDLCSTKVIDSEISYIDEKINESKQKIDELNSLKSNFSKLTEQLYEFKELIGNIEESSLQTSNAARLLLINSITDELL